MCALLGLMLTSGENFISIARLEICFFERNVDVFNTYFPRCTSQLATHTNVVWVSVGFGEKKMSKKRKVYSGVRIFKDTWEVNNKNSGSLSLSLFL